MPESLSEAKDTVNFVAALAREVASEGGSLTSLSEAVRNTGDLADAEEKLLGKAHSLWMLALRCSEWRVAEAQRLDAVAVQVADEIKGSK